MFWERLKLSFRYPRTPYWGWQAYLYGYDRLYKDFCIDEWAVKRNTWVKPGTVITTKQVMLCDKKLVIWGCKIIAGFQREN